MISSLITQIDNDEIVLPAIQRDFVWNEDRIAKMFDSIMRGYPLGIALLWETYLNIKYREFNKDYQTDTKYAFKDNDSEKRLKLVLDGQQRLQSLYIALEGTLNGKRLFFDILSGKKSDDFKEVFYVFRFLTSNKVSELNQNTLEYRNSESEEDEEIDTDNTSIFIPIKEILNSSPEGRLHLKTKWKEDYNLTDKELLSVELNMQKLAHSISSDSNILKVSTIDENKSRDNKDRKTESDILEVFVRINRQGISLSRSDLIFSMLKLNWKESAEELPDFIKEMNDGNNLGIDIDFVIRSLFAVSDMGSKFDVDLLRKHSNIKKVKNNYERTCNAIRALVDFMADDLKILNSSLIGGNLNLIPIVYYLSYTPNNLVPNSEVAKLKKALYIFSFTKPFSRYGDSRIGKFIRQELKPLSDENNFEFPLDNSIWWANHWENYFNFDIRLLQRNRHLTLHLLQGMHGTKVKYKRNSPEIDHIFPKSTLQEKEYEQNQIDTIGNFWILAKTKNQNKSNKHPKIYFDDVDDSILKKALIDREMFDFKKYKDFLSSREDNILAKIKENIGVKNTEIDYSTIWETEEDAE